MSIRKKKAFKNILYIIFSVVIIVSVVNLIMHFIVRPYKVEGISMHPTLYEGDYLIVNRFVYKTNEPERYDLIVFPDENGLDKEYVKRIIGLPGETVQVMNGIIYINAKELIEYHGNEDYIENIGDIGFPLALESDEYFVLGDNRNESIDSRFQSIGPVHLQDIVGRVGFRVLPFNSIGSLKNQ